MCGIAGYFLEVSDEESILKRQLELLAHRGPDSFGVHRGSSAIIGQTRLAVIDLVTGDPPISNEDGSIGVAFNGEIYNFADLREELVERGHRFRSQGDTEVIAHLAEELEPEDLARRLDGMFAFAIWDDRARRLVLARDRLGKKPLYYWWDGPGRLVFASEIKAVRVHPEVKSDIDESAIPALLTFGYVPTPGTFFSGIRSLPPGSVLQMREGGEPEISSYWSPDEVGEPSGAGGGTLAEVGREVQDLLSAAVSKRLIADVPIGAFLSGGVDSSAVVALMSRLSTGPIKTFTIGFEDSEGFDERNWASEIAHLFHTDHTEFVVQPDAVELIEELVWHHDQPFGDSSAIPTYLLSRLTREHVTVALSGDGGDELFGGYERFPAALAVPRYRSIPRLLRRPAARLLHKLPAGAMRGRIGSLQRFMRAAEAGLPDAYLQWLSYSSGAQRGSLISKNNDGAWNSYVDLWNLSTGSTLDRLLRFNLKTYLLDDLLPKADRMSMAHGLEVRSPFLDRDLVDRALTIPDHMKVRGFSRKRVLKEALRGVLPRRVLDRRKRGFGVPVDRWFREDLKTYSTSMLQGDAQVRSVVRGDKLDELIAAHMRGQANYGPLLWTLLTLEVFLRKEAS